MAVRNEAVRLELIDDFSTGMAKAAAATALLNRELNSLSGQAVRSTRVSQTIARDNDTIARSANRADSSINQLTGRLRLFADLAAIFGPALAPIGAVAIPAVAGLANQFGVAALAGGTAIIAFQGVGTALEAVNKAAIEPTAENLEAARQAMADVSPAARDMVRELQSLRPVMEGLRDSAAEGLFPGLIDSFDALEQRAPDVERILGSLGRALGDLTRDAGQSLASAEWDEFFDFLATDASATLAAMGRATGDLAHGLAELWMAFDPLNDDFSGWIQDVAAGFDTWATGLDQTRGFQEFIDYVRDVGPQVEATFVALADAVLEIAEAAAPIGGPILQGLESVAKVIGAIADSDLGTPIMAGVAAMALLSRATMAYERISATAWGTRARANVLGMSAAMRAMTTEQQRATMSSAQLAAAWDKRTASVRAGLATIGKGAAVLGALTLASTGAAEGMGLSNTMTLGLMGTLAGPFGAAVGTGVGFLMDAKNATDDARESTERFNDALDRGTTAMQRAELERLRAELNSLSDIDPWEIGKWLDAGGVGAPRVAEITGQIKALERALADTSRPTEGLAGLMAGNLAPSLGMTADQFDLAARNAEGFARALQGLAGFLDKREALRNYQQALDDFAKGIRETGKSFDVMTDKGRANQERLDAIADRAMIVAQHLKGMDRVKTLTQASKDIQSLAKELGVPQREVQALIDRLEKAARTDAKPKVEPQGIPQANRDVDGVQKKFNVLDQFMANPSINAQDHASGPISWVEQALRNLNGDTATVKIIAERVGNFDLNPFNSADGGTVPKTGLPYADRHLYLLADGEEIISNRYGQADRHRDLLKAINAGRLAGGGTAGGNRSTGSLDTFRAGIALDTFARSVDNASRAARSDESATRRHEQAVRAAEKALRLEEKALDDAREVVSETRDELRELKDRFRQFSDAVAGNFRLDYQMNTDSSAPALEQFLFGLRSQTATASGFLADLNQAGQRGLSGGFYNYLAQLGDPMLLDQVANSTRAEIARYERQYNRLQRLSGTIGETAATARYGAELRAQTQELRGVQRELAQARAEFRQAKEHLKNIEDRGPERTGKAVGREINNAAAAGARRRRG